MLAPHAALPHASAGAAVLRRLVGAGDRVYVTLGCHAPLTALDAATGETTTTYAGTERTNDPAGALQVRKGGVLPAFDPADGSKLAERHLKAPPVFDGLTAAGRLYLSNIAAEVICFGGP